MIAVYVRSSWLEEIGDMQKSLVRESGPARDVVSLLAGEVHVSYPFIDAKIVRRQVSDRDRDRVFLTVQIPVDAVRGIIDLTEAEEKNYGFMGPGKR